MTLYKCTNIAEIDDLNKNSNINKFLLATQNKEKAKELFSNNWNRPVSLEIVVNPNILYLDLNSILEIKTDEIIVAPFTKATSVEEIDEESGNFTTYKIILENQEFIEISEDDRNELKNKIFENIDILNEKLNACIELDNENMIHYENIRKLEQLLAKHNFTMEQDNYETDTTDAEKQSDLDDIARINLELDSLKSIATKVFYIRQENANFITNWKKDVIKYIMAECKEISKKYEIEENTSQIEESEDNKDVEEISRFQPTGDEVIDTVKAEAEENVAIVNTLLKNIKDLIKKQQNHARIAESMDSNYKALNNAFEMRNQAEELDNLVKAISRKIDTLSSENDRELLDKISKTSIQISTLLNYLNNPKSAVSKKITRFDELNILEENELKKEIAETIKNIRCEAELKKLRDDAEIIEDKTGFKKIFDKFTGRDKLDETMLDQIEVRQSAIRKTFKSRMPLAHNYSIHALIAEIEMFIKENEDDELVLDDVNNLRKMEEALKKNFVIYDSKIISILDQKNGKNLPLASKKISKKELIEIDTYRFLNKYGYDKSNDVKEPDYQDTVANEIKRIIDYIISSEIL